LNEYSIYQTKLCKIHVTIHTLWPDQFRKCGICSQFVYSFKNREAVRPAIEKLPTLMYNSKGYF